MSTNFWKESSFSIDNNKDKDKDTDKDKEGHK